MPLAAAGSSRAVTDLEADLPPNVDSQSPLERGRRDSLSGPRTSEALEGKERLAYGKKKAPL